MPITKILPTLIAVATVMLIFSNCSPTKKNGKNIAATTTKAKTDAKLIALYSGPCFGTCPVYTLTVFQDGTVQYAGERFTDKAGLWSLQLSNTQLKELKTAIAQADLMKMEDNYKSQIPDLALVKITYFDGDTIKEIKGKEDRPAPLMAIEKQLKAVVEMEGWKLEKAPDYGLAENEIPNEIIVQLKDDVTVEQFIAAQNSRFLQLEIKEKVAPNLNYYVLTYEPSVYGPQATLKQFKESDLTVDASFNKRTTLRK